MTIDENNYEQYLLSYLDGELDGNQIPVLLAFLRGHPDKQKELELLEMTRLPQEEARSFPDKRSLYHTERRPVVKGAFLKHYGWIGAAAAAMFLVLFFIFNEHGPDFTNRVAVHRPSTEKRAAAPGKSKQIPEKAFHPGNNTKEPQDLASAAKPPTASSSESTTADHKDHPSRQPTVSVKKSPTVVAPTAPMPADIAIKKIRKEQRQAPPENTDASLKKIPLPEISLPTADLANNSQASAGMVPEDEGADGTPLVPTSEKAPVPVSRKRNKVIAMNKEAIDNAITERVTDIQYKVSHPFGFLKGKEVKIGNVSVAFNK